MRRSWCLASGVWPDGRRAPPQPLRNSHTAQRRLARISGERGLMRIPINLASEPFRRDRPMLIASGACAVVLLALLGVLIFLIMGERASARDSRIAVEKLNKQRRAINAEQAKLDATLREPANALVLERSLLLNTLVQRKAISWTKIFADLESVMPLNV